MHGCWEERGCFNEQSAAVDSGHCCCPRAFGYWLMGLFGMPPLLDAEWWSGECVLLYLSPLWRLKGDRYLDTVPRLNDWNGNEGAPSQLRSLAFPRRPDLRMARKVISFTGLHGNDTWSLEFGVIFSYFGIHCYFCKVSSSGLKSQFLLSSLLIMFNSTQLKVWVSSELVGN